MVGSSLYVLIHVLIYCILDGPQTTTRDILLQKEHCQAV